MSTGRPVRGAGMAVTVLAGLDRDATSLLASGLLTATDRCAAVWVDPTTASEGHLTWRVDDSDGRHEVGRSELGDACLPLAMRTVITERLTALRDAGTCDAVILELHPSVEVEALVAVLCAGLPDQLARIDTVVCVLDTATWLTDLAGDAELLDRGLALDPDDHRGIAGVVASQLDLADRIVLRRPGSATGAVPAEQWAALRALAPKARRLLPPTVLDLRPDTVLRTGAHDPRCLRPLADRGLLDWSRGPTASDDGLTVVRWARPDRPLHPARLHDALDDLADGVIRSSGHLWFAHAADAVVQWDSCGEALHLGAVASFANAGPRTGNRLAFLGDDLDGGAITAVLERCVLTDREMDLAPQVWADLPHPLPDWRYDASEQDDPDSEDLT